VDAVALCGNNSYYSVTAPLARLLKCYDLATRGPQQGGPTADVSQMYTKEYSLLLDLDQNNEFTEFTQAVNCGVCPAVNFDVLRDWR